MASPHDHAADAERRQLLADAIETLPARLQIVLLAYYYDEKVMAEVGSEIGVGDKRASQLHCDALNLLRQYFLMRGFTCLAEVRP
jgi:RNA polymerase sigma factor for flagellar operon FliA